MAELPNANDLAMTAFPTVTFGGYNRAEVDAHVAEILRMAKAGRDELEAIKRKLDEMRAQHEAALQDAELKMDQVVRELDAVRAQSQANRDELDRARLELSRANEQVETLREEKEGYQRLAERLSAEEHQTRDILRVASRTAEEVKNEARREAETVVQRAEEQARHLEADGRRRVDELRREYERVRKEYDEFLKQAREIADALVRRIEDARAKWPV